MEGKKKDLQEQVQIINKITIRTVILLITLSVNKLSTPTKRHRLAEWMQKQDLYIRCLQETHFRLRDIHILKVRGW